jgi:inosose dehydratase
MHNSIKLAIAPIAWSNDDDTTLGGHISFEQCIKEINQAGFEGTEIGCKFPKDPTLLNDALDDATVKISSAWFSSFFTDPNRFDKTIDDFVKKMSFFRAVNAEVINVCECTEAIHQKNTPLFSSKKPTFSERQWQSLIDGLHDIGRIAYDFDIKLSYHFHLGTGVQNIDEIDFLMAHTSPELLGLLLDTGHAYAAGIPPAELIDAYERRINQVHLKDIRLPVLKDIKQNKDSFLSAVKKGLFTVPGDGVIDFERLFKKLIGIGYEGWWVVEAEQDPAKANPLEYAMKARQYIKETTGV